MLCGKNNVKVKILIIKIGEKELFISSVSEILESLLIIFQTIVITFYKKCNSLKRELYGDIKKVILVAILLQETVPSSRSSNNGPGYGVNNCFHVAMVTICVYNKYT